jgi:hypothetical protein
LQKREASSLDALTIMNRLRTSRRRVCEPLSTEIATNVVRLEEVIRSPAHPYRALASRLEPSFALDSTGHEPGQAALLLAFSLLLAEVCRTQANEPFTATFLQGRFPQTQPSLHDLMTAWRANLDRDPSASAVVRSMISQIDHASCHRTRLLTDDNEPAWYALVKAFEEIMAKSHRRVRRDHGVFFTPFSIVAYIVNRVDQLLASDLDIRDGLLSRRPDLLFVDPACGNGAFLMQLLAHARHRLKKLPREQDAVSCLSSPLQPRLVGLDLMPACCAAARLLLEFGVMSDFGADHQIGLENCKIHCMNALSDHDFARSLFNNSTPVIVGNPPYRNFGTRHHSVWMQQLMRAYRLGIQERKSNLSDDFIQFVRWGQYWIEQAGKGILAMVTSNTYLSGLTQRQMRASLLSCFDRIEILNLHGDRKRSSEVHQGSTDGNLFDIQQGVSIGVFVKTGHPDQDSHADRVRYAELQGPRQEKSRRLRQTNTGQLEFQTLKPSSPNWFLAPHNSSLFHDLYSSWPSIDEIFHDYISGVQTKRDALFVDFTPDELEHKVVRFLTQAQRGYFDADIPNWLRKKADGVAFQRNRIVPYMVAPWDVRWLYYEPRLLGRARQSLLGDFDASNLALVFMRQSTNRGDYDNFMATNVRVSDRVFYSAHGAPFLAPLYPQSDGERTINLRHTFLQKLEQRISAKFVELVDQTDQTVFNALDVFYWIIASVHQTAYRHHLAPLLRLDFPRIPWPADRTHFLKLVRLGKELTSISCIAAAPTTASTLTATRKDLPTDRPLPRISWQSPDRLILHGATTHEIPLTSAVWRYRVGGYPVLERWLKQRRNRTLCEEEALTFDRLVQTVHSTQQVIQALDKLPSPLQNAGNGIT